MAVLALLAAFPVACSPKARPVCRGSVWCEIGQARCTSGAAERCEADSRGCPTYVSYPCAVGTICVDGACSGPCAAECTAGESRCTGDQRSAQMCEESVPPGCARWATPTPCTASACRDGRCPACPDQCKSGQTRCAGSGAYQDCVDRGGCLVWGQAINCPADEICVGERCGGCKSGETRACKDACQGSGTQTCSSSGQWGECKTSAPQPACTPGDTRPCSDSCGHTGTETCLDTCQWSAVCQGDGGEHCQPGAKRPCVDACGRSGEQVCGRNCDWEPGCGSGCSPGETRACKNSCGNPGTEECNDQCSWSGECRDADPGVCKPGARQSCTTVCGSHSTHVCGTDCKWGTCTPGSETCNQADDNCNGKVDEGLGRCVQRIQMKVVDGTAQTVKSGAFDGVRASYVGEVTGDGYNLSTPQGGRMEICFGIKGFEKLDDATIAIEAVGQPWGQFLLEFQGGGSATLGPQSIGPGAGRRSLQVTSVLDPSGSNCATLSAACPTAGDAGASCSDILVRLLEVAVTGTVAP